MELELLSPGSTVKWHSTDEETDGCGNMSNGEDIAEEPPTSVWRPPTLLEILRTALKDDYVADSMPPSPEVDWATIRCALCAGAINYQVVRFTYGSCGICLCTDCEAYFTADPVSQFCTLTFCDTGWSNVF